MNSFNKILLSSFCVLVGFTNLTLGQATLQSNSLTGTQTAPNQYLGSLTNHDVIFKAFNVERMRIKAATASVQFTATAQLGTSAQLISTTAGGVKLLGSQGLTATSPAYSFNVTGEAGLGMYRPIANTLAFASLGAERARISAGGNFGINTTSPTQRLHIKGNVLIDGTQATLLFGGETSGSPTSGEFGIEYIDGTSPSIEHGLNFWKPFGSHDGSGGTNGFRNHIIFINNNGNIGMGVTPTSMHPDYKLSVCGAIRAHKIKVETGWCDFVFAENYKLMPLNEVEEFIKINKHLPDIPKGSEIEINGADLGFLVSKQMQKIEELTLHLIQQSKEIDELKKLLSK